MEKEILMKKRTEFFSEILKQLHKAPARIDKVLQQDQYYVAPDQENTFYDCENGDIAICISGTFHKKEFNVYYSIWQIGDILRIGVVIYDEELHGAFGSDTHNEVFHLWGPKHEPRIDVSHGCVFYDWEFEVPGLYDSYLNQEKFILGLRHMHFRVMRIIHDECQRLKYQKESQREVPTSSDSNINTIEDFEKLMKVQN